jgi:hypothetical protein
MIFITWFLKCNINCVYPLGPPPPPPKKKKLWVPLCHYVPVLQLISYFFNKVQIAINIFHILLVFCYKNE